MRTRNLYHNGSFDNASSDIMQRVDENEQLAGQPM